MTLDPFYSTKTMYCTIIVQFYMFILYHVVTPNAVNSFSTYVQFLYPLETTWCLQGLQQWNIGWKWVKFLPFSHIINSVIQCRIPELLLWNYWPMKKLQLYFRPRSLYTDMLRRELETVQNWKLLRFWLCSLEMSSCFK